jgi:mannose-6-phosphate isomerase-like protein (cupin superfamily)
MDLRLLVQNASSVAQVSRASQDKPCTVQYVHRTSRSSTAIAVLQPGEGLRPHVHENHDEIIVVLCGEATFRLGDDVRPVRTHDVVCVPAGTPHATVRAKSEVILVAVFAPSFDTTDEDRTYIDSQPPTG